MNLDLADKKVVVTGAANGIGTAIFMRLLEEGAYPLSIDLELLAGSELERRLDDAGVSGGFDFYQGDASDEVRMREIYAHLPGLYGLVNNAGILGGDDAHGGRTLAAWHKLMSAHAQAAYVATEMSYPKMRDGGSIVNIGSIEPYMAAPNVVLYTAAKGAISGMTTAYATTLADRNIRVNQVTPGNVNTERNKAQYSKTKEIIDGFEAKTPLRRSVEPTEVADAVIFLLSDRTRAMTGQEVIIDCGYTKALWDPAWTGKSLADVYKR